MKQSNKVKLTWKGFLNSIIRFPITILFLIAAVINNAFAIQMDGGEDFLRLLAAFILGGSVYAVSQLLYERFLKKPLAKIIFGVGSIGIAFVYYLWTKSSPWEIEVSIKTIVIYFILLVLFLWIPAMKSRITFNDSFMAVFKAFFTAILFSAILFLGLALILGATNMLIFEIDGKAFIHTANIVFLLFAPIQFLSLIPYYPNKEDLTATVTADGEQVSTQEEVADEEKLRREEALTKAITPAKLLEALISYVIIPITAVFTIILLLYIIMNITGDFWTDNLMEPMLVTYSITVIIVYLLAGTINNTFTKYFRMIFPKVLVPVVLFQTISSILKIGEIGVTYGRYYVILFGIFATVAGILFSIKPARKSGIIAPLLVGLSLISILPFIGAFTISKANQIDRLEAVLERNSMLEGESIKPNANISEEDRQIIITSFQYLNRLEYGEQITWLSEYYNTLNFERTFGFPQYGVAENEGRYIYISREHNTPIPVTGYDIMLRISSYDMSNNMIDGLEINGNDYMLLITSDQEDEQYLILKNTVKEIIRFDMNDIYEKYVNENDKELVPTEEVTFTTVNEQAVLTLVADNISINQWGDDKEYSGEFYVLIKIK